MTGIAENRSRAGIANYRPDIDGLRALAVVPVVLFHAKIGCPGGYVGVDIFFVISGYLISSLILREIKEGSFSLVAFWERRVRRILPALMVMVLATILAAWFLFFPEDFEHLARSAVAQGLLVSNVFFYHRWNSGDSYFGNAVDTMPLLHTWSLAVEEQFYLFFPLLFLLLMRLGKRAAAAIGIVAICSLWISVASIHSAPAAAFYLLPARAWELLLGVLIAMTRGRIASAGLLGELAGWLGIGLIGFVVFFYTADTPFPGWAAVPPCVGAALIIYSSESRVSTVGRLLSWRPVVFVGLISYSLYLWHWPLLVFSKFWDMENAEVRRPERVLLVLASFALAILSWKYVETPFRKRRIAGKRSHLFVFAGVSFAAMLIPAWLVVSSHGMPSRFSARSLSYISTRNHSAFRNEITLRQAEAGEFPELGSGDVSRPVSLLIWGDSHAMALTPVLDELCRKYGVRGVQATHSATAPILGYVNPATSSLGGDSILFNQAVLKYIAREHVKNVVIAAFWNAYLSFDICKPEFLTTIRAVKALGAKVYVVKDVPFQGQDVAWDTAVAALRGRDVDDIGVTAEQYRDQGLNCMESYKRAPEAGATVLDPSGYFLNRDGLYGLVRNDRILYFDYQHLTVEGSEVLSPLFEPIFRDAK